ncbi:hypothetical protein V2J09_004590 [Rumex salicifolius]
MSTSNSSHLTNHNFLSYSKHTAYNHQMETLTLAATSLAALLLLRLLTSFLQRRKLSLPPGPQPWPIIGNFNLIGSLPHRSLDLLSKSYGPIMMLRFGSHRVLVASSVETAKFILKTQDIHFASRPKTAAGKLTTYNYSDITWSPYGPYWRQARKMCLMELFSNRRLDSYEYIRVEETRSLLKTLFNMTRPENPIVIKDMLSTVSLNVISRMVLGKRYLDEEVGSIVSPAEFKVMLDELFLLNGVLNIGDWIPYLGFLDLQGYVKRMKKLAKKLDRFMEHVIDEHNHRRSSAKGWAPLDMVDVLLELADDPNLEVKLERHGVKAFTQLPEGVNPKDLDMEEIFGLSNPKKNPLVVFAKPRLATHLYNIVATSVDQRL